MSEDKANTEVGVTSDVKDVKKKEASTRKNKRGSVKNVIDTSPTLAEANYNTAVVGWGRMNPITTGHEKLVNKIQTTAKNYNADPLVFLSHSQDNKKNPLSYNQKIRLANKAFGRVVQRSNAKTIIQVMQELESDYDNIILVVGQDRVKEFDTLLQKYNGRDYTFKSIKVVSAGDRDPDAEGVEGMSASKMRVLAAAGQMDQFVAGLPEKLRPIGERVYQMVRDGMNVTESVSLEEALSTQQRMKRSRTFKRNRSKIAAGRRRASRKKPNTATLQRRAKNRAKNVIRKKVVGKTGKAYKDLSMAQRKTVDKRVAKRKAAIDRLAKKLVPQIRKEQFEYRGLNEQFEAMLEGQQVQEASKRDSLPRKRYHMLLNKNGSPKIDKRFKPFRNKNRSVEENVDALKKRHEAELERLRDEQKSEIDDAKAREKRKDIRKIYKEQFDDDDQILQLIDEIWQSVDRNETETTNRQ